MAFGYYCYSTYGHGLPTAVHFDYTWDYEFLYRLCQLYQRKHYCYWYLSNLVSRSMDYCYYSFPKCFQRVEIYLNKFYYYYCYCSRQFSSYQGNYHLEGEEETNKHISVVIKKTCQSSTFPRARECWEGKTDVRGLKSRCFFVQMTIRWMLKHCHVA